MALWSLTNGCPVNGYYVWSAPGSQVTPICSDEKVVIYVHVTKDSFKNYENIRNELKINSDANCGIS